MVWADGVMVLVVWLLWWVVAFVVLLWLGVVGGVSVDCDLDFVFLGVVMILVRVSWVLRGGRLLLRLVPPPPSLLLLLSPLVLRLL